MGLWGKCLFCKRRLSLPPDTDLWYVDKHDDDSGSDSLIPSGVFIVGIVWHPGHTLVLEADYI